MVHAFFITCRHYTFYVWKNFFQRHWAARYMLLPAYLYSCWSLWDRLHQRDTQLWIAGFAVCTAVTLVPAGLLEFRWVEDPTQSIMLQFRGY